MTTPTHLLPRRAGLLAAALSVGLSGTAAAHSAYSLFFPYAGWLNQPAVVLGIAVLSAGLAYAGLRRQCQRRGETCLLAAIPLLWPALTLFNPTAPPHLVVGVWAGSVWLAAALVVGLTRPHPGWGWGMGLITLLVGGIYGLTMAPTFGAADTFEFQVVAPRLGIAHPTGYPLYLLLGKAWTWLPFGSVAWRLNLGTLVYGVAALGLVLGAARALGSSWLGALLAALALGLRPTYWSQAIEAEVYTLHAVIVAGAVWLMARSLSQTEGAGRPTTVIALAAWLGLGLTNHLTTLLLAPAAALAVWSAGRAWSPAQRWRTLGQVTLASLAPLMLYLYLPLRWQAVNGDAMGWGRFIDWVVGGRFQGALQWQAWLQDPTRYAIVGRLVQDEWSWLWLGLAGVGWFRLARRNRRLALALALIWLAHIFYALNYHVPDLRVFLLPAQLIVALALGQALTVLVGIRRQSVAFALAAGFMLWTALANVWPQVDRSSPNPLLAWGQAVLQLPLPAGATILADSEKIAPLYYLQQAEGVRPDLEIMVLPDEAAYRTALEERLAAGRPVYLARYLPRLPYHLRSLGPLTEVSPTPQTTRPADATPARLTVGAFQLVGYHLAPTSPLGPGQSHVTLYWQADAKPTTLEQVQVRWQGDSFHTLPSPAQHPANNYYPTTAWQAGEMVPDFHLFDRPIAPFPVTARLQVAWAPPFTPPEQLVWHNIVTVELPPTTVNGTAPLRQQVGGYWLTGVTFPSHSRPGALLSILMVGYQTPDATGLQLGLGPFGSVAFQPTSASLTTEFQPFAWQQNLTAPWPAGDYPLLAQHPGHTARCGWLRRPTTACVLGTLTVSGQPLPPGAVNFNDQIALLDAQAIPHDLTPGGQLEVNLTWQALAPLEQDYTVFVQLLDMAETMVGQVDAWPVQGTYPTSQWTPGERISDSYVVPLPPDLPPGSYQVYIGWYLLADLRRLPLLDETGQAVDDRFVITGLRVP